MKLNTYLHFNGQCAEAFKFYEQCLGGKISMMMKHGESPMKDQVPANWHDKVMHVALEVGDRTLMGSDAPPQHYAPPQGFSVAIGTTSTAESERIYKALSEGGKITMPYQKTFWSPGFGMFVDRYGTPWMVDTQQPA